MMTKHKKDILPFFVNLFNILAVRYIDTWTLFMRNLFRGTSNCLTAFKLILTLDKIFFLVDDSFLTLSQIVRKTSPVSYISVTAYTHTPARILYLDRFSNERVL